MYSQRFPRFGILPPNHSSVIGSSGKLNMDVSGSSSSSQTSSQHLHAKRQVIKDIPNHFTSNLLLNSNIFFPTLMYLILKINN